MDLEKAMMLANARGAAISVNRHLGMSDNGMQLYDHNTEKELYYSCYLTGMKSYIKGLLKKKDPRFQQKIDEQLS